MKMWEIINRENLGKVYRIIEKDSSEIYYRYKVELRDDGVIELVSYSPYDDKMGFVHGNSMTFSWKFEEIN